MKIRRTINGISMEFELTEKEMIAVTEEHITNIMTREAMDNDHSLSAEDAREIGEEAYLILSMKKSEIVEQAMKNNEKELDLD